MACVVRSTPLLCLLHAKGALLWQLDRGGVKRVDNYDTLSFPRDKRRLQNFDTTRLPDPHVFSLPMEAEPPIPWSRFVAFIRQHTHDVRNGLNSLDLEISLMRELVTGSEAEQCAERVRKQTRSVAEQMRTLSAQFQEPQPVAAPIAARELLLIWREQNAALPNAPEVEWVNKVGDEKVSVDAGLIAAVFRELSSNAAAFSQGTPASITARREEGAVVFELCEPKTAPVDLSHWGEPFSTTRRHGYGLGLWNAHRLVKASGGALKQEFSAGESVLRTRITIPLA